MFAITFAVMGGLFMYDNFEFFDLADKQIKQGYTWSMIDEGCRAPLEGTLHIAAENTETGEKFVCLKLEK